MNGEQFIRRARRWARVNGVSFRLEASRGKGGHRMLYLGERVTTVKTGEIKEGLLSAMLKQLAIPKAEF
jgi:hypothetical protein